MSSQKQSKRIRKWELEMRDELTENTRFRFLIHNAPNWWNIFAVRKWMKQLKEV